MADIGTAYVQIVPKAEGISGQISSVLGGESQAAGVKAGGMFSKVFSSKVAKGALIAGGAIAAGIGVGSVALKKGIQQTAEYGDHIDKMSQKIGFTAEEYQKWDYVLKRAGTSVDSMAPVMKKLSSAAVENSAAFQQLGLSQDQVAKMSQGELFKETISRLSEMENQTERTALASQLLGRGATELGPLLNGGTEAIEEQMQIAEKYGMVMSDAAVKASAGFQDSMTTMQMTMTGLKNRMMAEFLPAATQVTDGLGKIFAGDMSGADDIVAGLEGIVAKLGEMIPKFLEIGGRLVSGLVSGLIQNLPAILAAAWQMIQQLGAGIVAAAPGIASKIGELVGDMIAWFLNGGWATIGSKMIRLVASGISAAVSIAINVVKAMVRSIANALGFSGVAAKVKATFDRIKEAIKAPIEKAKEIVTKAINKIKGLFPLSIGKIFSNLKIPHINISGGKAPFGLGGLGVKPSISVTWNKKAMENPYMFSGATLFGAGEAGDEILYGRQRLKEDIRDAVGGGSGATINNYITVSGAENPEAFANRLVRQMKLEMRTI